MEEIENMENFAKIIKEADEELSGSFFDPEENYIKKVQVELRENLKDFQKRFSRGAKLLIPDVE